jgi:hypothetical protein
MPQNFSSTRDLVIALRWCLCESIYRQRFTGRPGWEIRASKNGHSVIARADTRLQAWALLAEIDMIFYLQGPE